MEAAHVYQAINAVQAIMAGEGIGKTRENKQQGYRFRGIDDVYIALSRHMANAKLLCLPRVLSRSMVERPTKSGGVSTYVVLDIEFDFVSAVDGSKHTIRTMGEAMDTADKATNKGMSAAHKYGLVMALMIPTEGDNDADAHHIEKAPLEKQLAASVEWGEWAKAQEAKLREAKTMGELQELWAHVYEEAKLSPNGTLRRLASAKDDRKAELAR